MPIVEAVSKRLGVQFYVTDSIFGAEQPESTATAIRSYLEGDQGMHTANHLMLFCRWRLSQLRRVLRMHSLNLPFTTMQVCPTGVLQAQPSSLLHADLLLLASQSAR